VDGAVDGAVAPGAVVPVSEPGALVEESVTPPPPVGVVVVTAGGEDSGGVVTVAFGLPLG
jgi:hypothetical protein